jgi:hypothetical protein
MCKPFLPLRRSGIDPAALQVTNLFAFAPVNVITATTQLSADWAGLLKGYLYYVTKSYGGPAMQDFVLGGPLLSANAGGYIAKRSVHDWLYGAAMSHAACICCSSRRCGAPFSLLHSSSILGAA